LDNSKLKVDRSCQIFRYRFEIKLNIWQGLLPLLFLIGLSQTHTCKMMAWVSVPKVIIKVEENGQTRNWLIIAPLPAGKFILTIKVL
jgi:hypothetical protein